MLNKRYAGMFVAAIIVLVVIWARLFHPTWDYYPPERLLNALERSWAVTVGVRRLSIFVYIVVALGMMALFFSIIQRRWALHAGLKGLLYGMSLGVIWALGFLTGWAFLGTTLRAEFLNILVDLTGLTAAGWFVGLLVGQDIPSAPHEISKPWLAVVFVALGFVAAHTLGSILLAVPFAETAEILLRPESLLQYGLLLALGAWAGQMFVMLRHTLPFKNVVPRSAFFAFGVFGHSWIWFHVFFVHDFAGVFTTAVLTGLMGSVGVFVGTVVYEWTAGDERPV
ncbi:hypothetical protein [Sulfuriflexus mobilis]|uniref:hypothetical protein n=1 Tax=Sulfuriflexus mobilis TaxID=1811807 RepID=UPI000F82FA6A|nr:hypothetical protein [Sulfuriflexus mobilis]